jgi:hypothetical protein
MGSGLSNALVIFVAIVLALRPAKSNVSLAEEGRRRRSMKKGEWG